MASLDISSASRMRWVGDRTERQVQARITTNCSMPEGRIQAIRMALAHLPSSANVIGEEKTDPRVHTIEGGNIVFYDAHEPLYGSKMDQQLTVFSTFNGMDVTHMTNQSMRRRFRPYGVAPARGVTENSYESDRAGIAIVVGGTVTLVNNSEESLMPGQMITCVPPDVDASKRRNDLKHAIDKSQDQQGDADRYVGVIKTVGYLDCVTEFSGVVKFLLENLGQPMMRLSDYDRAVRLRDTHKFSDQQLRALELKKFVAYAAFTSWHQIALQASSTATARPLDSTAMEMAIRLGIIEDKTNTINEDAVLQKAVFGRILYGSTELTPPKYQETLTDLIVGTFPEQKSQRAQFVTSSSSESTGRQFLRMANEASKGVLSSMVKSLEEIGDTVFARVLTPAESGESFDAIVTK